MKTYPWVKTALILVTFCVVPLSWLPADGAEPDAQEIITEVKKAYQVLQGYRAAGEVYTEMDMSGMDVKNLPGIPSDADMDSPLLKSALKNQIIKHTFDLNLSRNGDFRIQWDQDVSNMMQISGAVWSVGGKYKLKIKSPVMDQPAMQQENRGMALAAATGVSGGAANTIPTLFYDMQHNTLSVLQNIKRLEDEKLDGEDCYVIAGDTDGQSLQFWISKQSHLILQRKHTIGATPNMDEQLTDENIRAALKSMNQESTPEAIARMRNIIKQSLSASAGMKGYSIERHKNIRINPAFAPGDFVPKDTE